jgi:MOSC domain-containing protein YiiM
VSPEQYRSTARLQAGIDEVRRAPKDGGPVEMIVCRPDVEARQVLDEATIDERDGLLGDNWKVKGTPNPEAKVTVMNARAAALVAGEKERWAEAGDQLYVDLDLSGANLPPGTRLQVGEALLEVSEKPHTGCKKFEARFGKEAMRFVNSPEGRELNLRGINTCVVRGGLVRVGDKMSKVEVDQAASEAAAAPKRSRKLSQ